jgi:hypothetical protein
MLVSDHVTCILPPDWTRLMNKVNSDGDFVLLFLKYSENTAKKVLKNALVKTALVIFWAGVLAVDQCI